MGKIKNFFAKLTDKFGKKKVIAIAVIIAIAIIVLLIAIFSKKDTGQKKADGSVEEATKRTIVNSISGTGTVESINVDDVYSPQTGLKVKSVLVKEGQQVSAGEVVAYLDTKDLLDRKNRLSKQIRESRQDKLDQDAEYDKRQNDSDKNRAEQIEKTKARLTTATNEYNTAKAKYDAYINAGKDDEALEAISLRNELNARKTTMESYQDQLEALQNDEDYDTTDAKKSYDESMDESLDSMQEQMDDINEAIADCTVRAKISGTVTSVNVKADDTYAGGAIIKIEGESTLQIEAYIDEYDIPDVKVGQKVFVKTDATRDEELEGVVSFVAPRAYNSSAASLSGMSSLLGGSDISSFAGTNTSSSASYLVRISLKDYNDRLRLGMNAKISIVTDEKKDVLSVPYESIMEDKDGSNYVYVVTSDKDEEISKKKVYVTKGIEGSYYTEIISKKIKEGTKVYVPASSGSDSVSDLINMMGSSSGV